MSLAYGTQVGTPTGPRAIERLEVSDAVLASGEALGWKSWAVRFSDGVSQSGGSTTMVFVRWDDGEIIATPDHVFVRADRRLVQAQMLTSGIRLLGVDGGPITVRDVMMGRFKGGIHAIGTDAPWPSADLAGHLLNTQGLVTGDVFVETNSFRGLPGAPTEPAAIDTPEYGLPPED